MTPRQKALRWIVSARAVLDGAGPTEGKLEHCSRVLDTLIELLRHTGRPRRTEQQRNAERWTLEAQVLDAAAQLRTDGREPTIALVADVLHLTHSGLEHRMARAGMRWGVLKEESRRHRSGGFWRLPTS